VLTALAAFETVEQHWYLGVYASLCIAMGLWYARAGSSWRRIWRRLALVPALGMLVVGLTAAAAPGRTYAAVRRLTHLTVRNDGPFEIYAYHPLARDVAELMIRHDAGVMTTSYGLAAELDYHRHLFPVVIGADYRGRESRRWPVAVHQGTMILVERAPLDANPPLRRLLAGACKQLTPGPVLRYRFAGAPARSFYTSYCTAIGSSQVAALRGVPPSR
jgi:hypothetical protein